MPDTRIPSTSSPKYRQEVKGEDDPTGLPVEMAVKLHPLEPVDADYVPATWLVKDGKYFAVVRVNHPSEGVGVLAEGIYKSWVRITDTGEVSVVPSTNYLVIT